jgi:hypothetical protein
VTIVALGATQLSERALDDRVNGIAAKQADDRPRMLSAVAISLTARRRLSHRNVSEQRLTRGYRRLA